MIFINNSIYIIILYNSLNIRLKYFLLEIIILRKSKHQNQIYIFEFCIFFVYFSLLINLFIDKTYE